MASSHRLAFLIAESEPSQGISTRKLLIESAKHNVTTAHSAKEAWDVFERFSRVDGVVIDSELEGAEKLANHVKEQNPGIRVVGLSPRIGSRKRWADKTVNSHDPAALLKILEEMGGRTDI